MLYFDRIEVDDKRMKRVRYLSLSAFFSKSFKFKQNICNGCHDSLVISMNLCDFSILNIKGSDYCCIICGICKNEAINLMENSDLTEKSGTL